MFSFQNLVGEFPEWREHVINATLNLLTNQLTVSFSYLNLEMAVHALIGFIWGLVVLGFRHVERHFMFTPMRFEHVLTSFTFFAVCWMIALCMFMGEESFECSLDFIHGSLFRTPIPQFSTIL